MIKLLQGILSSKSRREVWERNNAPRQQEPAPVKHSQSYHDPKVGTENTILCCGNQFTIEAHKKHMNGEFCCTRYGNVISIGSNDPWLIEQDAKFRAERAAHSPSADEIWRQQMVDACYEQMRKSKPRIADGTSEWMGEDEK